MSARGKCLVSSDTTVLDVSVSVWEATITYTLKG